jgi:hypothetical protein
MSNTEKKKVGRKKGQTATKDKYLIEVHNIKDDTWDELGRFPSLRKASKELNLSYGLLSDLNIGRRKIYNNFYRVINLRQLEKIKLNQKVGQVIDFSNVNNEIPEGINLNPETKKKLIVVKPAIQKKVKKVDFDENPVIIHIKDNEK